MITYLMILFVGIGIWDGKSMNATLNQFMNTSRNPTVANSLICDIPGYPTPNYSWTHDGADLSGCGKILTLEADSRDDGEQEVIICTADIDRTCES